MRNHGTVKEHSQDKTKLTMRLVESIPRGVVARRLEYPRPEYKCPNMVTEQVSIDDIWSVHEDKIMIMRNERRKEKPYTCGGAWKKRRKK